MTETGTRYTQLQKFVEKNDLDNIIKTADSIIQSGHEYKKAFHFKVVALIHLDRFEEASAAFQQLPEFSNDFIFEKAYCFYRLNRTDEALQLIDNCKNQNEIAIRELKGQLFYKQEMFEESYKILKDLIKETADEYDDERKANMMACIAHLANKRKVIDQSLVNFDTRCEDSFEIMVNTACYLMSLGKYDDAEVYLSKAEERCVESLGEDLSDVEVENELNVVKTQLACCKHFQKKIGQAVKMYMKIIENKPTNNNVIAVANNNILAANFYRNTYEVKKKVKLLQSEAVTSNLTKDQKRTVATNIHLIEAANAISEADGILLCETLFNKFPDNIETVVLLKAGVHIRFNNTNLAIEVLEKHMQSSTGSKLKMGLAITQLYLNSGNYKEACNTLNKLGDDLFRPGVVSTLATILIALGETDHASDLLKSAAVWNRKNLSNNREMTILWQQAADLYMTKGRIKPALDCLLQSLEIEPSNYSVLSKLTIAYAKLNNSMAFEFCGRLRERIDLNPKSDINYIESSDWLHNFKANKAFWQKENSPGSSLLNKDDERQRTKKRRKKLPKNYNPDVSPDPERWLPMKERSYFKKKKDRRNKEIGKGSQGTNSAATELYDITKMTCLTREKPVASLISDSLKSHSQKTIRHKKKRGCKR